MIKHIIIITLLVAGCLSHAAAQNLKGAIGVEPSHKANSMKSGSATNTIDVDLYTGIPTVSIPIFSKSIGGLDLGISLNYLAKGIKVNQLSSSAGLGWDLDWGGSIVRKVAGLEDEVTLPIKFVSTSDSLQGRLVSVANLSAGQATCDDIEPDIFMANIGGRSFEFSFGVSPSLYCETRPHMANIQVMPITEDASGSSYTNIRNGFGRKSGLDQTHDLLAFIIIDELGNKFYFDRGDYRYKHFSFPTGVFNVDSGTYYATETWNLTKVVTFNGYQVDYSYAKKYVNYLENVRETIYPNECNIFTDPDPVEILKEYYKGIKTHITQITYPHSATVRFDLDTSANSRCDNRTDYRLKNIIIENSGLNALTYRLNQAYFNSPKPGVTLTEYAVPSACSSLVSTLTTYRSNVDSVKNAHLDRGTRLKLKSIDKIGTDGTSVENYYSFSYSTIALPERFEPYQDYYGYFNNGNNYPYIRTNWWNTSLNDTFRFSIPYHTPLSNPGYPGTSIVTVTETTNWGQIRTFNPTQATAFSLKSVMNCSGGRDSLVFQDYTLSNPTCSYSRSIGGAYGATDHVVVDTYVGCTVDTALKGDDCNDGLCIYKIVSMDGYNYQNTVTTEYSFEQGQRFNRGGYTWYSNGQSTNDIIYTNYFLNPHEYVRNSNHGFGKATVVTKGYVGQQLSKTISYFTNLMFKDASNNDTSCMVQITGHDFHTMRPGLLKYRMGMPTKVETFDKSSFLTSRQEYSYTFHSSSNALIQHYKEFQTPYYTYFYYSRAFDKEWFTLASTKDTTYIGTEKMPNNHTYEYDYRENLSGDYWTDSKGDAYKTINGYNYYYGATHLNTSFNHPISSEVWKMGTSDTFLISYALMAPDSAGFVKYPATYSAAFTTPLNKSSITNTQINYTAALNIDVSGNYGTNLVKTWQCTKYDGAKNPAEVKINNQDEYISSIFDSSTGNLFARASNAKYDDIAYSGFEALDYAADSKGNWIYGGTGTDVVGSMTGTKSLSLADGGVNSKALHKQKYILSYWTRYTLSGVPSVALVVTSPYSSRSVTMTKQNTVGSWEYYSAIIEPNEGEHVEITCACNSTLPPSPTSYIDELRLCPLDASMLSYAYIPNIGPSSSADDAGNITYYEYDAFGRLAFLRDLRGNIIKAIETSCGSPWPTGVNYDRAEGDQQNPNQ